MYKNNKQKKVLSELIGLLQIWKIPSKVENVIIKRNFVASNNNYFCLFGFILDKEIFI